jgi:hypothetical protein
MIRIEAPLRRLQDSANRLLVPSAVPDVPTLEV